MSDSLQSKFDKSRDIERRCVLKTEKDIDLFAQHIFIDHMSCLHAICMCADDVSVYIGTSKTTKIMICSKCYSTFEHARQQSEILRCLEMVLNKLDKDDLKEFVQPLLKEST